MMMYTTGRERLALAALGGSAVIGLGVLVWQVERPSALDTSSPAGMVPARSQRTTDWDAAVRAARQVDLNTATEEELQRLPDVGPSLAKRIMEYRRMMGKFRRTEELMQVPGIGPKTYEALQDHVTVR